MLGAKKYKESLVDQKRIKQVTQSVVALVVMWLLIFLFLKFSILRLQWLDYLFIGVLFALEIFDIVCCFVGVVSWNLWPRNQLWRRSSLVIGGLYCAIASWYFPAAIPGLDVFVFQFLGILVGATLVSLGLWAYNGQGDKILQQQDLPMGTGGRWLACVLSAIELISTVLFVLLFVVRLSGERHSLFSLIVMGVVWVVVWSLIFKKKNKSL
jgi:energy-converting hydrogenase Eha subunit C